MKKYKVVKGNKIFSFIYACAYLPKSQNAEIVKHTA